MRTVTPPFDGMLTDAYRYYLKMELGLSPNTAAAYGSDVEATLSAGYDVRHGLIGPGVYASHGYERSHRDGTENTLKLLIGYIK